MPPAQNSRATIRTTQTTRDTAPFSGQWRGQFMQHFRNGRLPENGAQTPSQGAGFGRRNWGQAGGGNVGQSFADMDHNDRIRRLYAMDPAKQSNMFIFKDTDFLNWGYWTETTRTQNEASENLLDLILSFIPDKSGTILDIACGKGATTRHLLKHYDAQNVTGINISPDQIAICKNLVPDVTFQEMDAVNTTFKDESFDNLMSVEAICHFDTREAFLTEALRLLKPGGRLVFTDSLLRATAPTQPKVNFLESVGQYADLARKVGFDRAEIFDTTEETWNRFAQYHMDNAVRGFQNGNRDARTFMQTRRWLQNALPVAYVVGWLGKA